MLFVASDLVHQKAGIHDETCNQHREQDHAQEQQHALAPVKNDPANVQPYGQGYKADAKHHKKSDGFAAAGDAHSRILTLLEEKPQERRQILCPERYSTSQTHYKFVASKRDDDPKPKPAHAWPQMSVLAPHAAGARKVLPGTRGAPVPISLTPKSRTSSRQLRTISGRGGLKPDERDAWSCPSGSSPCAPTACRRAGCADRLPDQNADDECGA